MNIKKKVCLLWAIIMFTCAVVTSSAYGLSRDSNQEGQKVIWIPVAIIFFGIVATFNVVSPGKRRTRVKYMLWNREID